MTITELTKEFENIRPQLRSFILRITASIQDTEDIVQEVFIRASEKITGFRGESSLKTWLFTIASNLTKDNLKAKKRWAENVTDICRSKALANPNYFSDIEHLQEASPHAKFIIKEHIAFCFTCIAKSLPLEQQICILLKEVYEFKVSEISGILQLTEAMVKYHLHASRTKMTTIFEGRCALINKQGICHQCSELNGIFNPKQNFEIEKNKIELARAEMDADKEHLLKLRLQILKEIDPFSSPGSDFQLFHLEHNRLVMENFPE